MELTLVKVAVPTLTRPGSVVMLENYSKNRSKENIPMMLGVDVLKKLFDAKLGPLVCLRNLGLGAVDRVGLVKVLEFALPFLMGYRTSSRIKPLGNLT